MKYPHIKQHDQKDCGAACLSMISEFYGLKLPIAKFRELIKVDNQGANIYGIVTGASEIGFEAEALEGNPDELFKGIADNEIQFPFIARIVSDEMMEHFIVIYQIQKDKLIIGDPAKQNITKIPIQKFVEQWQGNIITFQPNQSFEKGNYRKGGFIKFFKFITNQKKLLAVVFVMSLIISLISIFSSITFQYIIDDALVMTADTQTSETADGHDHDHEHDHEHDEHEHEDEDSEKWDILDWFTKKINESVSDVFQNIRTVCLCVIMMFLVRGVLQALRGYLLSIAAKKVEVPLTLGYYNHLVDLPARFFGTRKTGELMSRFSDTSKIREAISTTALTIMIDTLMAVLTGIYLFTVSSVLFAITFGIMLLYAIVIFIFKNPIRAINHEIMENDAQVDSYLKESIDGIETIKAYQYEESAKKNTEKLFTKLVNRIVKGSVIYNIQEVLVTTIASVGVVGLLWSGAYLCLGNVITIGELISFYYLLEYFTDPVKNLINLQPALQTAGVAAERLNDVLDAEIESSENKQSVSNLKGDIHFDHIDFRYGNRELLLKDIDLKIRQGQNIAVVGESGCGKTTLTKLLMAFYYPEKGKITINGVDLAECDPQTVRKHIAYISQNTFLFSDTIYNNLKMGNENISNEEVERICRLCYADEFIQNLPFKYETIIDENGNDLSGGQKQRLAIARALLRKPDILIMDEATSNLDTITEESIKKTIEGLSENMTCIIIAHRLNTIRNCDYIYVMDKGRIAEQGTHDELIQKKGIYFRRWHT